jgi:hypothetical protein
LPADFCDELIEAIPFDLAVAEDPGSDDDVGGAGLEVFGGVIDVHAAAELEAAGISAECFEGGLFVARAEHDDVTATKGVAPIEFGEPARGLLGNKIRAEGLSVEAAADDLLHATFMEVDARSKHSGPKIKKNGRGDNFCSGSAAGNRVTGNN